MKTTGLLLLMFLLSGCATVCEFNTALALIDPKAFEAKYGDPKYYFCYTAYGSPMPPTGGALSPIVVAPSRVVP